MYLMTEAEVLNSERHVLGAEHVRLTHGMADHIHGFGELTLVRAGEAIQRTQNRTMTVRPGHLMIIGPGSWHAYEPVGQLQLTNLYLSRRLLSTDLSWLARLPRIGPALVPGRDKRGALMTIDVGDKLEVLGKILDPLLGGATPGTLAHLSALFALLARLDVEPESCAGDADTDDQVPSGWPRANPARTGYRPAVQHAVEHMQADLERRWTLSDLAEAVFLSTSQLVRVFRADIGVSPMSYLRTARVERLAQLLRTTDLSISAAARAAGWDDVDYAARCFRKQRGVAPREYRARLGQLGSVGAGGWARQEARSELQVEPLADGCGPRAMAVAGSASTGPRANHERSHASQPSDGLIKSKGRSPTAH